MTVTVGKRRLNIGTRGRELRRHGCTARVYRGVGVAWASPVCADRIIAWASPVCADRIIGVVWVRVRVRVRVRVMVSSSCDGLLAAVTVSNWLGGDLSGVGVGRGWARPRP